jgi:hypothetical protein
MNLKTFFKNAIRDAVKVGHALTTVIQALPAIITKVEETKDAVETASAMINPSFKTFEDLAYDVLAQLAAAIKSGEAVVNTDGTLNVTHTADTVTAVKAMIADIEGKSTVPVPAK